MSEYSDQVGAVPVNRNATSKLAAFAALASCGVPVLGGFFGVILGILALGQIRASRGDLTGAGMAWLGILLGGLQLAGAGAVLVRVNEDLDRAPRVVAGFAAGLCGGDRASLDAHMSTGLKPAVDRAEQAVRADLVEALGEYKGLGEQRELKLKWMDGEAIQADYDLKFARGAPAKASFTLVREYGAMRVVSVAIRSPVLTRPVVLEGKKGKELGDFSGGKQPKPLKAFKD